MRAVLISALLLLGCGESAPAAAPSSTVVAAPPASAAPPPSTTVARPVPEGAPVRDAAEIRDALAGSGGLVPPSWLWIDDTGASCMSGAPASFIDPDGELRLSCNDTGTRCVDTQAGVALVLRPGTRGPYLHAIVSYGESPVPPAESGARAQALEQRDEICGLLDVVRSSAPPIDPRGSVWGRSDDLHLSCDARVLADDDLRCESTIDAQGHPRDEVSCEATCWGSPDDCGVTRILARRTGPHDFSVLGGVFLTIQERDVDPHTLFAPISRFLSSHTCGAPAGPSAGSRTRRALCQLLQTHGSAAHDEDADGEPDEPPAIPGITLADGLLSVNADDTRESYCTDAIEGIDPDRVCDELRCDDAGTRCVFDDDVFLVRAQPAGPELFAVIHYASAPPPAEEGRVPTVIERRDRVCELFTMVRSGALRIDPRGYMRAEPTGLEHACGLEAIAWARADVDEILGRDRIRCSQSDCGRAIDPSEALLATRDGDQRLWIYGRGLVGEDTVALARYLDGERCER